MENSPEIAKNLSLNPTQVESMLPAINDLAHSSYRDSAGLDRYTTRSFFKSHAPWQTKLIGAFRFRLD